MPISDDFTIKPPTVGHIGPLPGTGVRAGTQDVQRQARDISEYYQSLEAKGYDRADLLPPIKAARDPLVDITNIFLGDEMAAVGISLDHNGLDWDLETAKEAWTEHPIRTSIAIGLDLAPGLGALAKSARLSKLRALPDAVIKEAGLLDESVDLAKLSDKGRDLLKQQAWNIQRKRELASKIEEGTATRAEKWRHWFDQKWGNSFTEIADPDKPLGVRLKMVDQMNKAIQKTGVHEYLKDIPEDISGPIIARFVAGDTSVLKRMTPQEKAWGMRYAAADKEVQQKMLEEGFTTAATRRKVGENYVPLLRRGTPFFDEGDKITLLEKGRGDTIKAVNIPRTSDPRLLERTTGRAESLEILKNSEAITYLEAERWNDAARVLKGHQYEKVRGKIYNGDIAGAIEDLSEKGIVDTTPSSLTIRGLMGSKLLFERFRYIRDLAMDTRFVKTADEVAAMSEQVGKNFRALQDIPNSDIVKRMIAKKQGASVDDVELGWVHDSIFDELAGPNGQAGMVSSVVDLLDYITALHKVSKTAFNIPTHGQNIAGNYMFLMQAGFNPLHPENHALLYDTALPAILKYQKARKSEKGLETFAPDAFGTLESRVGGDSISVLEELNDPIVDEIIEKSSLVGSEGLAIFERISKRTKDSHGFLKGLVDFTNKSFGVSHLDKMADMYMAEDAYAKFGYFLHLRQDGMSRTAAALEVSRRLPMYHTVGEGVSSLRRFVLPWLSFPAEALRITKNNTMDYPLRMAMHLHAMQGLQSVMYPFLSDSEKGIRDAREGLPLWAQKPVSTVITPFRDKNDDIRAAVLDFFPHASFLPQNVGKESPIMTKLPFGADQPFSIFGGLMKALTGVGSFGEEIPTNPDEPSEVLGSVLMNSVAFVAPPWLGKYLLNTTAPSPTYRAAQDFGKVMNPSTGKEGSALYDFFINNFSPIKMRASSGEQAIANQSLTDRALKNYRGRLARDWNAYTKSGDWESAAESFTEVMETYNQEWGDPIVANRKSIEWLERHIDSLSRHPKLRGLSQERIISELRKLGERSGSARSRAMAERVAAFRRELIAQGGTRSQGGTKSPFKMLGGVGGSGNKPLGGVR